MGSGERAVVSICVRLVIASAGMVMRRPEDSSLRMERSVGRVEESFSPRSGSGNGVGGHARFFNKHAKKGLVIFKAAEVMGMPDEKPGPLPEALEAKLKGLLGRSVPLRAKVFLWEEVEGSEVPRRCGKLIAQR